MADDLRLDAPWVMAQADQAAGSHGSFITGHVAGGNQRGDVSR
jgi:hypothetical protein